MPTEDRIKRLFKAEKNHLYATNGGQPDAEGINDIILFLAGRFKIPAKGVKDIINPNGYFGGPE